MMSIDPKTDPNAVVMTSVRSTPGTATSSDCKISISSDDDKDIGYEPLAKLMGRHPEAAAFRRFSTLNMKNLLYYQAELVHLEVKLRTLEARDQSSKFAGRQKFCRSWLALSHAGQLPDESGEQWRTFQRIREVLKEYSQLNCCMVLSIVANLSKMPQ